MQGASRSRGLTTIRIECTSLEAISARIILAVESKIEAIAILSQIAVVRVTHPVEAD